MQKKIVALAVASALSMPALALAGATVYGKADVGYVMTDNGGQTSGAGAGTGNTAAKRNQVASNVSRLGFKGSEDLGNGMTGVWQMEGEVDMDTGTTRLFDSNTFLGVAGDFGTVVLGQHDTPYKMSTRGMDVFEDSIADNRSVMGIGGLMDYRGSDVLAYITPDFSGFSAAVAMISETDSQKLYNDMQPVVDSILAPGALTGTATKMSATSLSANYGMDNWKAVLGYLTVSVKESVLPINLDITGTKVGGSYAMDAFAVNAVYEMLELKESTSGGKMEQNNIYISGTYNVSDAGKVKLGYTMAGESKDGGTTNTGSGATQVSLGYDHAMSKNTTVYALYTSIANDTNASYYLSNVGSTAGTAAAPTGIVPVGSDPSAIAVGVRIAF